MATYGPRLRTVSDHAGVVQQTGAPSKRCYPSATLGIRSVAPVLADPGTRLLSELARFDYERAHGLFPPSWRIPGNGFPKPFVGVRLVAGRHTLRREARGVPHKDDREGSRSLRSDPGFRVQ